jgi:predicted HTH transcriptional regulator
MQNSNRNTPRPIWKIFTLFGFLLGLLLYILINQAKEKEQKPLEREKSLIPKPKKLPKSVKKKQSHEEKVQLDLEELKLSVRQKSIVEEIMKRGKMYPSELQDLLPNVSSRTIRRDMNGLEKLGLVEQKGATKSTYYKYIGS